jgi:hypothetical protein
MRLTSCQSDAIQLGYCGHESELFLDVTLSLGFNLAVGSRGIKAVQCIMGGGITLQWFGSPQEAPKTRRLAVLSPLTAIKARFDVSRNAFPYVCD